MQERVFKNHFFLASIYTNVQDLLSLENTLPNSTFSLVQQFWPQCKPHYVFFSPSWLLLLFFFNVCVCVHIYYMFCLYFCFLKAIMVQEVCQSHLNFFFLTNRYNTAQSMIAWTQRCRNVGSENRLYNYMWILHGVGLAPQPLIIIYCEIITIISLVNIHHTLHCYK